MIQTQKYAGDHESLNLKNWKEVNQCLHNWYLLEQVWQAHWGLKYPRFEALLFFYYFDLQMDLSMDAYKAFPLPALRNA